MYKTFDLGYTVLVMAFMTVLFAFLILCSIVAGVLAFVVTTGMCIVAYVFVTWGFVQDYKHDKLYAEED